jgi:drug/metabolite transporter (DMT)-like permease
MIIGTLPVVIAIVSNLRRGAAVRARDGRLPWAQLAPSLALIAAGIGFVNQAELARMQAAGDVDLVRHGLGALLAVAAVACWTWYPIRNADWLRTHADRSPSAWATAQGLATLPMAAAGYALLWGFDAAFGGGVLQMPFGPRAWEFIGLMLAIGLFASWLGTLCWNEASQRLPPALAGQLIVFETMAALAYALALRGQTPAPGVLVGVVLLVAGVLWALRVRPRAA